MEIKIRSFEHEGVAPVDCPRRASAGSAAVDLQAAIAEPLVLEPGGALYKVPVGFGVELPEGTVGLVFARSGLGVKHGIALSNGVGVIDSDYRGEIMVGLCNLSNEPYTVQPLDRIAQFAVLNLPDVSYRFADELSQTGRGEGGFGSSGR